jgi:predicted small secreted protein
VSKIDTFKAYILNYIHHFSMYDYAAYAWLILIFFVTILLAIMVAKKSPVFSILILIISLTLLFAGPFVLKHYLDKFIRPTSNKTLEVKKLTFSNTLIINGSITNLSKKSFSTCNVNVSVVKSSTSGIQNFINQLKPLLKQTISIDKPIDVNTTEEFRAVFDNYSYSKDVNISIKSECY